MYESRAIARYIIGYDKAGTLIPTDPCKRALFEQAMSIQLSDSEIYASTVVKEKVYKPVFVQTSDEAKVKENEDKDILAQKLDVYEIILSETAYLAGGVSFAYSFPQ